MIQVSHLSKRYGPHAAIQDLSFEIGAGEIVGFLGPNGAGKSTTMKILTGFMPATEGTAMVAGYNVFEHPIEVKRNVGYLPENPPVYHEMVVEDYLAFAATIHEVEKSKISAAISNVLERTALGDVRGRLIGNLSKGYRQRVGLAQALLHNPKVLVLDEPTVGLDPRQIIEIRELIKSLAGDHTVILSSHILPEVTATCQRIIMINKGRIVATDTLQGLLSRYGRSSSYTLHVKNASSAGVGAIKSIAGIQDVRASGGQLTIELKPNAGEVRDQIVNAATENNMGVLEFITSRISLEEIYLKLTGEESQSEVA